MIKLKKGSKIYLMCPPKYASGGPELMHQLANKLELLGMKSLMYYYPITALDPVNENYKSYNTKFVTTIEDHESNLIIVPEVMVPAANKLKHLVNIRKCIWWLSVDNFFKPLRPWWFLFNSIGMTNILETVYFNKTVHNKEYDFHLVQSFYAFMFLKQKGIDSNYLSDYLNKHFIGKSSSVKLTLKEDIVLYNPKKGLKFTQKLINNSKSFKWIPIENMKPQEVVSLLERAKVYVDFGMHPGKDRFPREAAILNCCIITGKKGSAQFYEDISIDDRYKIEDRVENIQQITELIESCFTHFEKHIVNFEPYRQKIISEEARFIDEISATFV